MSEPADVSQAIHAQWRPTRPLALWLTLAWALVTFVPPFFARQLSLEIAGASVAVWAVGQFGPLVYVLLAWWYERRANRLDEHEQRTQRVG